MPQMMEHSEHGKHYALDAEIEGMLKSGWKPCTPKVEVVAETDPQYPQAEKPRLGRPPKNEVGKRPDGNRTNDSR